MLHAWFNFDGLREFDRDITTSRSKNDGERQCEEDEQHHQSDGDAETAPTLLGRDRGHGDFSLAGIADGIIACEQGSRVESEGLGVATKEAAGEDIAGQVLPTLLFHLLECSKWNARRLCDLFEADAAKLSFASERLTNAWKDRSKSISAHGVASVALAESGVSSKAEPASSGTSTNGTSSSGSGRSMDVLFNKR